MWQARIAAARLGSFKNFFGGDSPEPPQDTPHQVVRRAYAKGDKREGFDD
jgi:hypothetical protein